MLPQLIEALAIVILGLVVTCVLLHPYVHRLDPPEPEEM